MKSINSRLFAVLVSVAVVAGLAPAAQRSNERQVNLQSVVEAERAFARAAATKNTRDAFLEFLADDGIIFQPGPINGKEFWRQRQPGKGLLSWYPVYADVSSAGDLGYTTGPFEFRPNGPDDKPAAFGQYFTIWKKQPDGSWKAVLDRGISHGAPTAPASPLKFAPEVKSRGRNQAASREAIMNAESEFAAMAEHEWRRAIRSYFAPDVIALREKSFPAIGKSAAMAIASAEPGSFSWKPATTVMSASGDLGYTFGAYERKSPTKGEKGVYVRMWKLQKDRRLRIVIDVQVPTPAEQSSMLTVRSVCIG